MRQKHLFDVLNWCLQLMFTIGFSMMLVAYTPIFRHRNRVYDVQNNSARSGSRTLLKDFHFTFYSFVNKICYSMMIQMVDDKVFTTYCGKKKIAKTLKISRFYVENKFFFPLVRNV